jgi:NAD(P)H-dependent flavin oxidoreductase YrpB (nitropropane dioxygenase family)
VLDAVDIPVVAAGGSFDGRGLTAALSYGAAGVGMGTRFLLTADSAVPRAVKELHLSHGLDESWPSTAGPCGSSRAARSPRRHRPRTRP